MSQAIAQAGQFVVQAASAATPYVANAAANYAASAALTAAQNLIFGPVRRRSQGPRREEIRFQNAAEGAGVPRIYGRQRIGGQIIWITGFTETTEIIKQSSGGKGVSRSVEQQHTVYKYSVSLAIGLGEGEISRVARVWADGRPVSLKDYETRLYKGTTDQLPDPLIEAVEGIGKAPAYRGLAYLVFENLPLESFGNRMPQFNFEVERTLTADDPEVLENQVTAVTLIPGSGETVYSTTPQFRELEEGVTIPDNIHNSLGQTDSEASLDHLLSTFPNLESVSLIASWFGTDLRAGECLIEPRIENNERTLTPDAWSVAGITRATATPVSQIDGTPAYGGTPDDKGVREIITVLKSRGLQVMFHPFILMDVPPGNTLPDPLGAAEQGAFPWRGRITCHPRANTDQSADARIQVEALFARYRLMVLHYAQLCAAVGGVDSFLLGSELRGLTNIRDQNGAFPAVEALLSLATEVRAILGADTQISYGADWSEYANYRPADGSGDILFPLDQLWSHSDIDFIGIDNYMPLTDWREGGAHLDAAHADSIYDREYLASGIAGGEYYDWFYTDQSARNAQSRSLITDTAYGEDWIFRVKDLAGWWSNSHHERSGGLRNTVSTAWTPQAKPIVFTELGCASIDKGPNQPNVFLDPKSSESAVPHYSTGTRDDLAARRFLEAHFDHWQQAENNPTSTIYGASMVDASQFYLYAWDARPFPDYPLRRDVWADAENWVTGHWLNGRAGRVPLSALITAVANDSGLAQVDASACATLVTGYMIPGPMAGRDALEPLFDLYQLDAVERAGVLIIRPREGKSVLTVTEQGLVVTDENPPLSVGRAQEADLPARLSVTYTDSLAEYQAGVASVTDPAARGDGAAYVDTAVVLEAGEAEGRAEALLAEARAMRTTVWFGLPAEELALEPSDVVTVEETTGAHLTCRITEITDGPYRALETVRTDPGLYRPRYTGLSGKPGELPLVAGPAAFAVLDIPILPAGSDIAQIHLAAYASPWPGQVSFYSGEGAEPDFAGGVNAQATMGRLVAPLAGGPFGRWDQGNEIRLQLIAGNLSSLTDIAALGGAGLAAIKSANGAWEVLSYRDAILGEDGIWTLTTLLRGQRGTETEALAGAASNARIVFLTGALETEALDPSLWGTAGLWQAGPVTKAPGAFPYRTQDVQLTGSGARPFAPAHLKIKSADDTLVVSWTRRSRIGGDSWQAGDIPLGETIEQYRVRGLASDGSIVTEKLVDESITTIPGSGVAAVEVAQISTSFGPGRPVQLAVS